jgi:hypothetical protein
MVRGYFLAWQSVTIFKKTPASATYEQVAAAEKAVSLVT